MDKIYVKSNQEDFLFSRLPDSDSVEYLEHIKVTFVNRIIYIRVKQYYFSVIKNVLKFILLLTDKVKSIFVRPFFFYAIRSYLLAVLNFLFRSNIFLRNFFLVRYLRY